MTKFKVGDKVRITGLSIFGANHIGELGAVKQVDTLLCTGGYGLYVEVGRRSRVYKYSDVEHAEPKPTKNQRITTLESEVAELKAKVEALEKAQKPSYKIGIDYARTDADISKVASQLAESLRKATKGFVGKPNTNEQRKAIIAEAKAFIEDVTKRMASSDRNDEGNATFRYYTTKPEFHVNSKKRTVVALVKGLNGGGREVFEKAIAKCAPDDVFNANIGKAIALGRALGLDVSKFEQAVKPTEVVVGQVVHKTQGILSGSIGPVTSVGDTSFARGEAGLTFTGDKSINGEYVWAYKKDVEITDDTEAQY